MRSKNACGSPSRSGLRHWEYRDCRHCCQFGIRGDAQETIQMTVHGISSGSHYVMMHVVVASMVGIFLLAPTLWFALDREMPYVRSDATIVAVEPKLCGLPDDAPQGRIIPGSCVMLHMRTNP